MKASRLLVTFFVLVAAQSARADFWAVGPRLRMHQLPASLAQTSLRLRIFAAGQASAVACTGAVVSDDGHVLTASHCVEDCLKAAGAYTSANRLDPAALPKTCDALVDGAPTKVQVLSAGECPGENFIAPRFDVSCRGFDIAVLKLEPALTKACLELETAELEPRWAAAISYPLGPTNRRHKAGGDVTDDAQYFSEGEIIPFQETCEPKNAIQRLPPVPLAGLTLLQAYAHRVDQGKLIQMTVDILPGSSGGPIVGDNGKLLGLAQGYAKLNHGLDRECLGATFMSPVMSLPQDLTNRFSRLDQAKIFACVNKRVSK